MTTRRKPSRIGLNGHRVTFGSQGDKDAYLGYLDQIIATARPRMAKFARARRRKVSGWVVGA